MLPKRFRTALAAVGTILLLLWGVWGLASLSEGRLVAGESTWVPAHESLGVDLLGPFRAARHRLVGGNPYREPFDDPLGRPHIYPPAATALFFWAGYVPERYAYPLWGVLLTALTAGMTAACLRTRRFLGLSDVPLTFALAAVAWSTPFLFAVERGNCDLVAVALVLGSVPALRRRSARGDVVAGTCLALAAWLKVYPAALILVLPLLRRPRAAVCAVLAVVLIGLADPSGVADWLDALRRYTGDFDVAFVPSAHSLTTYWRRLFAGNGLDVLTRVPGVVGAAAVLAPPALGVTLRVARRGDDDLLLGPYFLWLTALATFLPPVSNDYNLVVLPLLLLATWDRRDGWLVHLLLLPLLLWWQPFQVPLLAPKLLFGLKLAALAGGALILARGRDVKPCKRDVSTPLTMPCAPRPPARRVAEAACVTQAP